eukprot:TRINITY_DN46367_c0_g1_i1.p2 TRINITY_DN46367_c0_g1~~TRINITY_DN46367_c0_g1_i1.p2  ORF type:complete len:544 (+),score=206.60 TRINITY_DN46367_c0_g1_i1:149-1780(+)
MVLEAVMVCVDNSDYTRNGDYAPTRFESQTDAVNLVCGAKTQQNMENSVGVLTTAGDRIEVMITPTSDLGKMISILPKIKIGGQADLLRGIQTAQLALKHRQNKNQKQRIIAFVGSPVTATEKELETLGKNLKKNNVSLDLVSFGEVEENTPKLEKLIAAVNSNDTSNLVEVPVGPKLLSDVLLGSRIIGGDADAAGVGGGGDGFGFGIDPNEDPELALALRISMEEERARQQAASGEAPAAPAAGGEAGAAAAPAASGAAAAPLPAATDAAVMEAMGMEDMDEELRQALLLSMQDAGGPAAPAAEEKPAAAAAAPAAAAPASAAPAPAAEAAGLEGLPDDMDEELKAALALSMADCGEAAPAAAAAPAAQKDVEMKDAAAAKPAEPAAAAAAAPAATSDDAAAIDASWFQDPSFVNELLGSLPGVDINDPRIQSALREVSSETKTPAELKTMLNDNAKLTECCDALFRKLDKDGSGFLSPDEVNTAVKEKSEEHGLPAPSKEKVMSMFKASDKRADGKLDKEEFKAAFTTVMQTIAKHVGDD